MELDEEEFTVSQRMILFVLFCIDVVEVEDLPADKPQLFSKVDLDEEEVTAREEETAVLEDLEEGEIDMKAGTLEPGEVRLTEDEDAKQR